MTLAGHEDGHSAVRQESGRSATYFNDVRIAHEDDGRKDSVRGWRWDVAEEKVDQEDDEAGTT